MRCKLQIDFIVSILSVAIQFEHFPARRIECFMTKNNSVEGFISQGDIDKEIKNAVITESIPLDCIWMIEVDTNWQVKYQFYIILKSILSFAKCAKCE